MEDFKKRNSADADREIIFSNAIKAGKRIYYLDVKKNRKGEMFLAITESKKIVAGEGEEAQVSFEKHKIFLYREDFEKFMAGLQEAVQFIADKQGLPEPRGTEDENREDSTALPLEDEVSDLGGDLKINLDF